MLERVCSLVNAGRMARSSIGSGSEASGSMCGLVDVTSLSQQVACVAFKVG